MREPWLPRLAFIRSRALSCELGRETYSQLLERGAPVLVTDAPWRELAGNLGLRSEQQQRSVLLIEELPFRAIRANCFSGLSLPDHYYFVSQGLNCPYRCHYCFLYANPFEIGAVVVSADMSSMLREAEDVLLRDCRARLNLGEDMDSFALEHLTGQAARLIRWISTRPGSIEFRTKAPPVPSICRFATNKVVVGVSLMPQIWIERVEPMTASLLERLDALRLYSDSGLGVALKFEPSILCADWRDNYEELLQGVGEALTRHRPEHASLGCFRFRPRLEQVMRRNFPKTSVLNSMFEEYADSHWSYQFDERREFYEYMIAALRRRWPELPVYLSMESNKMCERFGAQPWVQGGANAF